MKTIPNSIKNKLQSYVNHIQKSEKIRLEVEAWFLANGINTDIDGQDIDGHIITDIVIDTGMSGEVDGAIILMEQVLNNIE